MIDSIALIVILSFLIPIASTRLLGGAIPSVAFEIFTGFIIGNSGLKLITTNSETMEFLSTFGLAFLMFLGGLESDLNFKKFSGKSFFNSPIFIAILTLILTVIFSWFFSKFLISQFNCASSALYLTLIFSTTSVAIVFPTLKSRNDLKLAYKQTLLYAAFLADFLTLTAISIFSFYKEKGEPIAEILLLFSIFGIAFLIIRFLKIIPQHKAIHKSVSMLKHKPHIQLGIRGAFALLFLFMFLAEKFGIEVILGSFIAGLIISNLNAKETKVLRIKLEALGYGFFIPFFFIYQGAKSTLPLETKIGIEFLLAIITGGILIKVLASLPLKIRFSLKDTIAGGILLSGRLSLIIAASIIGLKLGIIDEEVNSAIIILAAITCILSPTLFGIIKKPKKQKNLI